jgi:hypothetical protein
VIPPPEVIEAVRGELQDLRRQLREAEELSKPCPPGHWRWADVTTDGYHRKSEDQLAADRNRNQLRATELTARIAVIETWLVETGREPVSTPRTGGDTAP